jgi:putative transposase
MGEISPAPDNLLNRDFSASAPNEKWLTDITEFQIPAGKVYLSPMIDCFDGMVVELVDRHAPGRRTRQHDAGCGHPDRDRQQRPAGGAFGSWRPLPLAWLAIPDRGGQLVRSMSRKACSPDNAACEGFFGRLKNECSTRATGCHDHRGVRRGHGRLHPLVQRGAD